MDIARQRAYLARFLVKVHKKCLNKVDASLHLYFALLQVEIPPEHLGDSELTGLYEQYVRLVEEFKIIHREREAGKKVDALHPGKSDLTE